MSKNKENYGWLNSKPNSGKSPSKIKLKVTREKTTPKLGGGSGMSKAYIITKKGHQRAGNSCENQRGLTETKATLSPSYS